MSHLALTTRGQGEVLELQTQQRGEGRRDEASGAYIESERARGADRDVVQLRPFTEEELDALSNHMPPSRTLTLYANPLKVKDDARNTPAGMVKFLDEAGKRARMRFDRRYRFGDDLKGQEDGDLLGVIALLTLDTEGETYPVPELAVRTLIFVSGSLTDEDYIPEGEFPKDVDIPTVWDLIGDITKDDSAAYIAGLGVSFLIMAMAKPFVSRVTSAARDMAKNLRDDLRIKEAHLNPEVFANLFNKYLRRVNLKKLAGYIADKQFPGWQWGTAYAARHGAGTSHIVAITTFVSRYQDFPFWGLIPEGEVSNYFAAVEKLNEDPLALFPIAEEIDMSLDRLRVSGMPVLLATAILVLAAGGEAEWRRYENIPRINSVGSLTTSTYINIVMQWTRLRLAPEKIAPLIEEARYAVDMPHFPEEEKLRSLVQPSGKSKSFLQRVL